MTSPSTTLGTSVALREFHPFEAAGRRFVYLVPSAAVFALDDCSSAVLDSLAGGPRQVDDLTRELHVEVTTEFTVETVEPVAATRAPRRAIVRSGRQGPTPVSGRGRQAFASR